MMGEAKRGGGAPTEEDGRNRHTAQMKTPRKSQRRTVWMRTNTFFGGEEGVKIRGVTHQSQQILRGQ